MPTKKQLSKMWETEMEFPQTRREDDPMYVKSEIKPQTMTSKKQTPLQEAIHWFQTEPEAIGRWNTDEIVAFLQPFLKKEQQTFSEIFDAGQAFGTDLYRSTEWGESATAPDKTEFLNQYKPEVK